MEPTYIIGLAVAAVLVIGFIVWRLSRPKKNLPSMTDLMRQ
jgi:hypothetical protein